MTESKQTTSMLKLKDYDMKFIFSNNLRYIFYINVFILSLFQHTVFAQQASIVDTPPIIVEFIGNQPMTRVGRPFVIITSIRNPASVDANVMVSLKLPEGIRSDENTVCQIKLAASESTTLRWTLIADNPIYEELVLEITNKNMLLTVGRLPIRFLPAMEKKENLYIPKPISTKKDSGILIGAHHCPLWEHDSYAIWSQLKKHPERIPALGFYAQENPEIADWETKWAVEHGIDFFIYVWYRINQGGPVEQKFGSHLHKALFNSQFQDMMKFTIMWENQQKGKSGVSNEDDLLQNLMPFWMENYFKRSNYLIIDNKPVLFIYRPEFLIEDLGSIEKVRAAFEKMRQVCRDEGFDGLWLLGEYRYADKKHLELMENMGLDYSFAYCWHVENSPSPQEAIDTQMQKIKTIQEIGVLPQITTLSQGWSGWRDEGSIWTIPPKEFETLLLRGKAFVENLPKEQLSGRMLLLDNWNEWGEGHYLAPYTEYGFEYLDAIRKVFTNAPATHKDLIPDDLGMGPYENAYREWLEKNRNK
ncbi:MAG: glycoside hydrolase family 99-like domain-containing protein [Bacteroidota bacterium]